MVVVPSSWPEGTGFGDAVITAPGDAGFAGEALAAGCSEGLQAAKNHSDTSTATAKFNCFIDIVSLILWIIYSLAYISGAANGKHVVSGPFFFASKSSRPADVARAKFVNRPSGDHIFTSC
jgi:hypothetical protein